MNKLWLPKSLLDVNGVLTRTSNDDLAALSKMLPQIVVATTAPTEDHIPIAVRTTIVYTAKLDDGDKFWANLVSISENAVDQYGFTVPSEFIPLRSMRHDESMVDLVSTLNYAAVESHPVKVDFNNIFSSILGVLRLEYCYEFQVNFTVNNLKPAEDQHLWVPARLSEQPPVESFRHPKHQLFYGMNNIDHGA